MIKKIIKNIPTIKIKYIFRTAIILFVFLIIAIKRQKEGMLRIGNTIIAMKNLNKQTDLSQEETKKYEEKIKELSDKINNFTSGSGNEVNLGNGIIGSTSAKAPNIALFTEKSDLEQKLGRYNDAIRTIYLAIKYYPGAKILQEALGMVYGVAGETNLAIGIYNQLISKDPENTLIYKKNIIYLNIMANNVDKASSAYMDFIKQGGKQDLEVTNQIRSMRGLGPLNELKEINN